MAINDIYLLIRDFTKIAINNPLVKIYQSNQDASQIKKPNITINIKNFKQVDREINISSVDGVQEHYLQKACLVSFTAYSDVLHEAATMLNILENALFTQLALDVFRGNVAALKTILSTSDISAISNTVIESRAILEIEFLANQNVTYNTSVIETVDVQEQFIN